MTIERFEVGARFSEMTVVTVADTRLIHISGQVAENTSLDVTGQTRQVLGIVDRLLAKAGAGREHISMVRIFLASAGDYAAMNSVWDDWVQPGQAPARTTIATHLINPAYKVEIEVQAAVKNVDGQFDAGAMGQWIRAQDVELDLRVSDERSLRQMLANRLARRSGLSEQEVREGLLEREALGSTSLGHGVALPHARVDKLDKPMAIFLRLAKPIALNAPDDEPVDLVLALLMPRQDPHLHLQLFAQIAELLSDPTSRGRLRQLKDVRSVAELFLSAVAKGDSARAAKR